MTGILKLDHDLARCRTDLDRRPGNNGWDVAVCLVDRNEQAAPTADALRRGYERLNLGRSRRAASGIRVAISGRWIADDGRAVGAGQP